MSERPATVGAALVRLLEAYGVSVVFGVPGVHTIELYRGLEGSTIRHVTPRHEQAAGFMADGYARSSGRPGVCFLITGPGVVNAATALGQAYADSSPVLAISSVNRRGSLGHGAGDLHESRDQRGMIEKVTAFSFRALTANDLVEAIARAFVVFEGMRPRPVHIEIPTDLLGEDPGEFDLEPMTPPARPRAAADALELAAGLARQAERPLLVVGGGAKDASAPTAALAARLDAPVIVTTNARGLLAPDHPLLVSASPSLPSIRKLLREADLTFSFGAEWGRTDFDVEDQGQPARDGALVRVDIDALQLARNNRADLSIVADAPSVMADLDAELAHGDALPPRAGAQRASQARAGAYTDLSAVDQGFVECLEGLRAAVPEARMIGDGTGVVYAGNLAYAASAPRGWFNAATGFGALGFALPAALGARLAEPDRPVICLVGDGGLQFVLGELGTAAEIGGPLAICVFENGGYGAIKAAMRRAGVAPLGVDLPAPDFCTIARAYGLDAFEAPEIDFLEAAVASALRERRPTLVRLRLP